METWEREYHVARVLAAEDVVVVGGSDLVVAAPSRRARAIAATAYRDAYREARLQGVLTAAEARGVLVASGEWSAALDAELAEWEKSIDDARAGLYENRDDPAAVARLRGVLAHGRAMAAALEARRDALSHATCEAVAAAARARSLAAATARTTGGWPAFPDPRRAGPAVDEVVEAMAAARLDEAAIRELARTEPWASAWMARDLAGRGLFDAAAADLTDEQRALVLWSRLYDAAREHPEPPADRAFADDDMFDGWRLIQQRKRAGEAATRGSRAAEADQVYVPVREGVTPAAVNARNSPRAKAAIAMRRAHLEKHGTVAEGDMPDRRMERQLAANRSPKG